MCNTTEESLVKERIPEPEGLNKLTLDTGPIWIWPHIFTWSHIVVDDLTSLLGEIMQEARNLTKAERSEINNIILTV